MISILIAAAISLNGSWDFRMEEGKGALEIAAPAFEPTDSIPVPGCFDVMPKWFMKRGTGLYRKCFTLDAAAANAWLVVDGIGLYGRFWVDGREIGVDDLPWSKVELPVGALAAGEHTIVAAVDNRFDWKYQKLVRQFYDFHCFGGFFRGVSLSFDNRRLFVRTRDYTSGLVEIEAVNFKDDNFTSTLLFDGKNEVAATFAKSKATVKVPDFKLWAPETPNLHRVTLRDAQGAVTERFGIRTIEAKNRGIYLNGKRIFLKGFNRHDQQLQCGVSTPESLMITDIQNLKAMGGNYFRGAHYPQSQRFLDLCDENGVLFWEESLGWGNGQKYTRLDGVNEFNDVAFCEKQIRQTRLMVRNSFNHPSVIIFAFLNEFASETKEGKNLADKLIAAIKAEDSGRLVTFACNNIKGDISNANTDIIAFNTYPGTIYSPPGLHDELVRQIHSREGSGVDWTVDHFRKLYPDKTIIISEMGVGATYGEHDPSAPFRSEEFQDEHNNIVAEAAYGNADIAGISFWQLYDTRTCWRDCFGNGKKPLAMSCAGSFTADRKPKLCVKTLADWFKNRQPANLK